MSRSTRYFGITTDLSGSIGTGLIANSITFNNSVETAEARDEKGKLLDLAAYSESHEISVDGLFVGSGVGVGTTASIGGKSYLITASNKTENNTAFQTGSITARCGDTDTVIHPLSGM